MSTVGKEDVYESEGTVEEKKSLDEDVADTKHPDIELVSVDIDEALKKYKGRVLNLKAVDFSDSIAKKRRSAYGSTPYVLEVAGAGYSGHETPSEKLNRILYEIADLNEQIKTDESSKNDMLNEEVLDHLAEEVKNLQSKKSAVSTKLVSNDGEIENNVSNEPRNAKLSSLESRLRRLERVLGSSSMPPAPILDTIDDLKLRCEMLNEGYVKGLEKRLNMMLTKKEQVEEKREKNEIDGDTESKVNELHDMMNKWDVACSNLPSNVNKVKAYSRIHEQAQHFASRLSHLKSERDKLEKEIAQGRSMIVELESTNKKQLSSLFEKVKTLETTVAALK